LAGLVTQVQFHPQNNKSFIATPCCKALNKINTDADTALGWLFISATKRLINVTKVLFPLVFFQAINIGQGNDPSTAVVRVLTNHSLQQLRSSPSAIHRNLANNP
jgi:hypothetical protein